MAIFNFPYHKQSTEYPESGYRAKLGNSYTFTAPPIAPDTRTFTLTFATMRWFTNTDGSVNLVPAPGINLGLLYQFYEQHKLYAVFFYDHPMFGRLPCRFNKPLKIPKGLTNGDGAVEAFDLEFIEAPGMLETYP